MAELKRKKVVEIEKSGRKVRRKVNKDSSPQRDTTVADLTKAFGAQAVGLLVGGLLGGRDGAIQGGAQGAALGKTLNTVLDSAQKRDDQRHDAEFKQDLALDTLDVKKLQAENTQGANSLGNRQLAFKEQGRLDGKVLLDLTDSRTGGSLKTVAGKIVNQKGQQVPVEFQHNIRNAREDRTSRNQAKNIGLREETIAFSKGKHQQGLNQKARHFLDSDVIYKGAQEQLAGLRRVDDVINQASEGNSVAFATLQTQAARFLAGEKGTLSDGDIARYGVSQEFAAGWNDWITGKISNKITPRRLNEFKSFLKVAKSRANIELDIRRGVASDRFQRVSGVDKNRADRVTGQSPLPGSTEAQQDNFDDLFE